MHRIRLPGRLVHRKRLPGRLAHRKWRTRAAVWAQLPVERPGTNQSVAPAKAFAAREQLARPELATCPSIRPIHPPTAAASRVDRFGSELDKPGTAPPDQPFGPARSAFDHNFHSEQQRAWLRYASPIRACPARAPRLTPDQLRNCRWILKKTHGDDRVVKPYVSIISAGTRPGLSRWMK